MTWHRVATVDDIPVGEPLQVQAGATAVALVRCEEGVFAVSDTCTHEEESMSSGFVEGCSIECPRHGASFDVRTGEVLALPATEDLPTYPVKIEGTDVFVEVNV